ncbi:hypothetical protein IFM89_000984, partial [Coptis chinensis]
SVAPLFPESLTPKEGVVKKVHSEEKFGPQSEKNKSSNGHRGYDKQNALVEELHLGYFTQGKEFLVEAAKKVGIEGAAEFLDDPNKGVQEVYAELEKYSDHITGVPYYVINGKNKLSGGQPPEVFARAFRR